MTPKAIQRSSELPLQLQRVAPSPWFQQAIQPPTEAFEMRPLPGRAKGLPPQWVQKVGQGAKEDYSQALQPNGICLVRFWICLGPVTPSFFLISFFLEWECLCLPTTVFQKHKLSGITVSQLERNFCFRMNCTLSLIHI